MCGHCHDGTTEGGKDLGQDGAKNSAKDRAKDGIDRRSLLALGVAAAATAAGVTRMLAPSPAVAAHSKPTSLSADDALSALKSGNARYVSQPQECVVGLAEARARVAAAQSPWVTIISCADSRVPPELVFGGLGLGELFVARNAGNLVDTATMGTVEYGAAVLGSPLIVVMGHSHCGAVSAACDVVTENATYPGSIGPMIDPIVPAALAVRDAAGDFLDNAVRESAKRTAARLASASFVLADLLKSGKLKIVAAHYELVSGVVTFIDPPNG
jgi:carbonic anhydrase